MENLARPNSLLLGELSARDRLIMETVLATVLYRSAWQNYVAGWSVPLVESQRCTIKPERPDFVERHGMDFRPCLCSFLTHFFWSTYQRAILGNENFVGGTILLSLEAIIWDIDSFVDRTLELSWRAHMAPGRCVSRVNFLNYFCMAFVTPVF